MSRNQLHPANWAELLSGNLQLPHSQLPKLQSRKKRKKERKKKKRKKRKKQRPKEMKKDVKPKTY